jgi:sugar phosphate isomerase/epimerase
VRDLLQERFEPTIRAIAQIGFVAVEPYESPMVISREAGDLYRELGLEVPSAHIGLPIGHKKQEVLDAMAAIGSSHIVSPWMDPDNYSSPDKIAAVADKFNEAARVAGAHGMRFSVHNHWFEFEAVDGTPAYKHLLEKLEPEVLFQLDTYWAQVAGQDAATIVSELGRRAPSLHIKDGPGFRDEHSTAVGKGIMDIEGIIRAGGEHTEWLIVELDSCATDMMEAVASSYDYLVGKGLARGNA